MEIAHEVHKSGGIDLKFASEQRRLDIGLDGWTVAGFQVEEVCSTLTAVQWDRPEGSRLRSARNALRS